MIRSWLCLALLCFAVGRVGAQGAPPADTPGQPPAEGQAREWTPEKSAPPEIFSAFREKLDAALTKRLRDPARESFHFVVLFNSADTQGLSAQRMRDIYYGLLRHYLIGTPDASDKISFVPFQLKVRDEAVWNQTYSTDNGESLYRRIPDAPIKTPGLEGGNDVEGALLTAAEEIGRQDTTDTCVFITLSNTEVSQSPSTPSGGRASYPLTNSDPEYRTRLENARLTLADRGQINWVVTRPDGVRVQTPVYWRIYLPTDLKRLGDLKGSTRDQILSGSPNANGGDSKIKPNLPQKKAELHSRPANAAKPPQAKPDYTLPAVIAIVILLVLGAAGYMAWLTRPREVMVGVTVPGAVRPEFGSPLVVKYGAPLQLSGSEGEGAAAVTGLPEKLVVARLEVSPSGAVLLQNDGNWQVENAPVTVGREETEARLAQNLADRDTHYKLTLKRTR